MWLTSYLPEWVFTLGVLAGIVGILISWVLSFIPFVVTYRLVIQVVSVCILAVSLFFSGAEMNESAWTEKNLEADLAATKLELEAERRNIKIETKIVTQIKEIQNTVFVNGEKIIEIEKELNTQCKPTAAAINLLNATAQGKIYEGLK
jgi:5-bromo-4-chloroindolyl phosphate hydrolysis protein